MKGLRWMPLGFSRGFDVNASFPPRWITTRFALNSPLRICFSTLDLKDYVHLWSTHLLSFVPFTPSSHLIKV
jgi:hypothetical protein